MSTLDLSSSSRPPLSPLLIAAPSFLLFLLILLPQSRLLTATLLPVIILLSLTHPITHTSGDPAVDFAIASAGFQRCLVALDRFYWTEQRVEEVFVRLGEKGEKETRGWRRWWWAAENTLLQRGVGRRWQVAHLPSCPSSASFSRVGFACHRATRALFIYLAFDLLSYHMQHHPYFVRSVPFHSLNFGQRQLATLSAGAASILALTGVYETICAVQVLVGWCEIEECPALMKGDWRDLSSVKSFWGRFWHQSFRRPFTSCTSSLLSSLSLPSPSSSSPLSSILALLLPFLLSALQHAFGIFAMHRRNGLRTAGFFLLQPLGIGLERVVRGKGGVERGWKRLLGVLWTVGWLLSTAPLFFDELVQGGMWEVKPPFSVTEWVLKWWWNMKRSS